MIRINRLVLKCETCNKLHLDSILEKINVGDSLGAEGKYCGHPRYTVLALTDAYALAEIREFLNSIKTEPAEDLI